MTPVQHTTETRWFVARTGYGRELRVRDRLAALGVEYFIPTGTRRNYRGKETEHALIPNFVFIRATKKQACDLKVACGLPVNYIFDYATHTMMTVRDSQLEDFRKVLAASIEEGGLVDTEVRLGDRVRVTEGPLAGIEGYVVEIQGKFYLVVELCLNIFAKARIPRAWLELV